MSNYIDHITIDSTTKYIKEHRPQYELIKNGTFTKATSEDLIITLDNNDNTFLLTDALLLFETPEQETYAEKGSYGQINFYYTADSVINISTDGWTQAAGATNPHGLMAWVKQEDGIIIAMGAQASGYNWGPIKIRYYPGFGNGNGIFYYPGLTINKVVIKSVTGTGIYKLYGKRVESSGE